MSTTDPNSPNNPPTTSTPRAEGDKLAGCYALIRRLSAGEGVEVWLANDEVLGKDVSLHFIPDAVRKDTRALQELRLDIKRNRQLIHPNILRVYDLVEESEWVAISMDTFEGEPLTGQIEGNGRKVSEIRPWVEQLAHTLEEAHKINVLHRDLCPSNLCLSSAGKLLVANFGISRTIRDAETRAGVVDASRIPYESPQSREGKAAVRADDVYSFGAIVLAALTGKPPGSSVEVEAALQAVVASIPANWRTTIAACLGQNPETRPQNAAEVARLLTAPVAEAAASLATAPTPVAEPAAKSETTAAPIAAAAAAAPVVAPTELKLASAVSEPNPAPAAVEAKPAPVSVESKPSPSPVEVKPADAPVELKPAPAPAESKSVPAESKPIPAAETTKRVSETPAVSKPAETPATTKFSEKFAASRPSEPAKDPKKESEAAKPAAKAPERPPSSEFVPRLYPERSGFPTTGLIAAAVAIAVIAIVYHFTKSEKAAVNTETAGQQSEQTELKSVPLPTPPVSPSTPAPEQPVVQTTQPKGTPPVASATPSLSVKAIAEKTAALDKTRANAQAAEKSHDDLLKQQEAAEASMVDLQKSIDDKTAAAKPLKKAAEEAAAQIKKMEEDKKAAETAALEAQKIAADKARLAEEKAQALAALEKTNAEKMAGPAQIEKEVADLQKVLEEKQRAVETGAKAVAQADAVRQQQLALVTEQEREIERLKTSDVEVMKQKEAADAEKGKLDRELAEMQKIFKQKMDELESKRKQLEGPGAGTPPAGTPPQSSVAPSPMVVAPSATPPPSGARVVMPRGATPAPATPMITAKNVSPAISPSVEAAGGNSLGMKFVPVGDVEFCIWQTRVQDFEVFAKAVNLRSTSWKGPGFKQGPEHPVVNVSWQEAIAFCKWLTEKERKENLLTAQQVYRLPTDLEWSKAVGLPEENGKTPELRDMGVPDVYPWGTAWPPPPDSGNYTGEETGSDVAIRGYNDGFAWTSPVGSFPPNKFGIYDMGGNVWQWCMDTWNADSKAKVLRGASWYNGALKLSLLSSCRVHAAADSSTDNYGFRIVRAKEETKSGKK